MASRIRALVALWLLRGVCREVTLVQLGALVVALALALAANLALGTLNTLGLDWVALEGAFVDAHDVAVPVGLALGLVIATSADLARVRVGVALQDGIGNQ